MSTQSMKAFSAVLAIVMMLGACQSTPTTLPAGVPSSSDVTPALRSTPSPLPILRPFEQDFRLYTQEPILPMGASGAWDSGLMDPGAVVYHEGQFHMFFDAVPYFPALISIGYAVSSDGITWTRVMTEPVFTIENIPWQPQPANFRANSVMVVNGIWVLYFSASNISSKLTGLVGRATAESPTGPWTVDAQPALQPGANGEWDAGDVGHVEVVKFEQGYRMYFSSDTGIGMATSPDGIQWTKYDNPATSEAPFAESDPVIAVPAPYGQHDPNVVYAGSGWQMVYRSDRGLEYATSADGIHWTPGGEKPLISSMELAKTIWYAALVIHGETSYLYFEAGGRSTSTYLATWMETPAD